MSAKMCLVIFPLGSFLDSQMALLKFASNHTMVHFFRVSTMLKFMVKREKVDSLVTAGSIFSTFLRIHLTEGWLAVQLKVWCRSSGDKLQWVHVSSSLSLKRFFFALVKRRLWRVRKRCSLVGGFIKGLTRYDKESFGLGNRLFVKTFGNTYSLKHIKQIL